MKAWVYARRTNARAADDFADSIRERGDHVLRGNSKFYAGEVHWDADVVYHDGLVPEIQANHDAAGVRCERWDVAVQADPDPGPDPREGYTIEQSGSWYKLLDADGEQVGKSQRSRKDAWALLEAAD